MVHTAHLLQVVYQCMQGMHKTHSWAGSSTPGTFHSPLHLSRFRYLEDLVCLKRRISISWASLISLVYIKPTLHLQIYPSNQYFTSPSPGWPGPSDPLHWAHRVGPLFPPPVPSVAPNFHTLSFCRHHHHHDIMTRWELQIPRHFPFVSNSRSRDHSQITWPVSSNLAPPHLSHDQCSVLVIESRGSYRAPVQSPPSIIPPHNIQN